MGERSFRPLLWAAAAASLFVVLLIPPQSARADAGIYRELAGIADGATGLDFTFLGDTNQPFPVTVGERLQFTVHAAPGSQANPFFAGGSTTFDTTVQGSRCDANQGVPHDPTKCFAIATVYSNSPGAIHFTIVNLTASWGAELDTGPLATFYEPRAIVPAVSIADGAITEVTVQNMGTATATVAVAFNNPDGSKHSYSTDTLILEPGQVESLLGQMFLDIISGVLPANFNGVVTIASDQPIAAVSHRETEVGDRITTTMQRGFPLAKGLSGNTVTLPYVSNQLERTYNTEFTVVNTGRAQACVVLTYSFVPGAGAVGAEGKAPVVDTGPGGGGCGSGYRVPVNGEITFAPVASAGKLAMPASTRNSLMAVTAVASNSPIGVTVNAYTTDAAAKAAGYEGFVVASTGGAPQPSDIGTSILIPLALKTTDGYYTQVLLSNAGDVDAAVTITYEGNTGTHPVTLTVPAHGVANHSVYSDTVVPLGFVGAARVESSVPVAAVLFRAKKVSPASEVDEDLYTAVNGIPVARASKTNALPVIMRRVGADAAHTGRNSWVSVSVPGGGSANLTLVAVGNRCGANQQASRYTFSRKVTGSFIFYQNADSENGFGLNPACFDGGVIITSDVPVVAVASYITDLDPGDGEGVYNAITP